MATDVREAVGGRRLALAAAGGVLCFLAYTSFGTRVLGFVCLVPVLLALDGLRTGRAALRIGVVFGLVMNLLGYHWLVYTMREFGGFPLLAALPLFFVLALYQGGLLALFSYLAHRLQERGWPPLVAVPAALASAERLWLPLFPSYLGAAVHELPVAAQTAELGGPILVSVVVGLGNVALYELAMARRRPLDRRSLAIASAVVVAALGYGVVRMAQIDERVAAAPSLRLGLVQASVGIKQRAANPRWAHGQHLKLSIDLQRDHRPDLLIWPESGYHFALPDGIRDVAAIVTGPAIDTPLLFGAGRIDADERTYNTAYLVDASGLVLGSYDKNFLLAFGEYIPGGAALPWLYQFSPATASMTHGSHLRPLELPGKARIGVLICYEDLLPWFTRDMMLESAPDLLINLTNDAWFGDGLEPQLHLALARLRAIEQRRFLARATNTGISAIVDPSGRVTAAGGVYTRESVVGEVRTLDGMTPFARSGDVIGWLGVLVTIGLGFVKRRAAGAEPTT